MTILQYHQGNFQKESTFELNSKLYAQSEPTQQQIPKNKSNNTAPRKITLDDRRKLQAKNVMSNPVVTARKQDVVSNVINTLNNANLSHVVIVNSHQTPLALININQLNTINSPNSAFMLSFCHTQVLAVQEHTTVREIAKIFMEYKTSAICVTNSADELTGIICRNDLLSLLVSGTVEK